MRFVKPLAIFVLLSAVACGGDDPTPFGPSTQPTPPPTIQLSGTVVEIGGGAVPNASVVGYVCNSARIKGETRTDEMGAFVLTIEAASGGYCVRAKKDGYVESVSGTSVTEGIILRLMRLRQTTGIVAEVEAGPVAGAKVSADGTETVTDSDGVFVLGGVGRYLNASAVGFVGRSVVAPQGQDVFLGIIPLQRQLTVSIGSSVNSRISAADISYELDYDGWTYCSPCKRIDLQTTGRLLKVHLRWDGPVPLQLWVGRDQIDTFPTTTAEPGQSSLEMSAPIGTQYLLVGFEKVGGRQPATPLSVPVPFELTAVP